MPEVREQALIEKIYAEVLSMKKELHEMKSVIIPEVEPDADELEALTMVREDVSAGRYKPWREVKKELENQE